MIRLTTATKANQKTGAEMDDSLYMVRIDSNNLALRRGDKVEAYYGDVRTALTRAYNYAIKGSSEALTLESILAITLDMDNNIKELKKACIEAEPKKEGAQNE